MTEQELKDRSKKFAHDCVKYAISLPESILGRQIKGQLIRSATSVAANYRSACVAQTKNSFISKLSISIEEADESEFWIEFANDELIGNLNSGKILQKEANELFLIFNASRKTSQNRMKEIKN